MVKSESTLLTLARREWRKLRDVVPIVDPYVNILWHLDKSCKSILDVGCGEGKPLQFILSGNKVSPAMVVGIDVHAPTLKRLGSEGTYDGLVVADAKNLPIKEKSFDVILCLEVIEHLEKEVGEYVIKHLEEIARKQVILSIPVGVYRQSGSDKIDNPHLWHKGTWFPGELKRMGYKVRSRGGTLRKFSDEQGLLQALPKYLKIITHVLITLASPLWYLFPSCSADMLCVKNFSRRRDE